MANVRPPMFTVAQAQDVLRRRGAPMDANALLAELVHIVGDAHDPKKMRQRVHQLVHDGYIKASPDPNNPVLRVYTLPDVSPTVRRQYTFKATKQVSPAPVPIPTPAPENPLPKEVLATGLQFVPIPTPTIDLKGTVSAIADAVAEAIGSVLRARIEAVVQDQLQQALDSLPAQIAQVMVEPKGTVRNDPSQARVREPKAPKGPEKTRITIVGLLAGQAQMIANEYKGKLHLEFVEQAHTSGQRLKGLCHASEAVITMTGFISHSTEDLIKSRNGNLIRVAGGMSSLRTELNRFVTEGESA